MANKKHTQKHKEFNFNMSLLGYGNTDIAVNSANWSINSRNSYSIYSSEIYCDTPYGCRVCKAKCIFTAKEQQHAYEVEKRHINQRHVYCNKCYQRLSQILDELRGADNQWAENKRELENDITFLTNWLALLNELAQFRNRINTMLREMLEKRLKVLQ